MARIHERVFALLFAVLFLATSLGFSAAVIWQIVKDNQANKSVSKTATASNTTNKSKETKMLKGTQLQNFNPVAKVDSLQKIDQVVGTGDEAKPSDTITVNYTGALASSGVIFESSFDSGQTATFPLSGVIAGWSQGIPGMKVGGKRRLLIPAALAYGSSGQGSIPPNSDLVFDVELVKIGQ
ncbi:MAG TPA: FKBP-type peptidyl-prolyl cis-trans isomerase [Candidatus Saccharimonadales bacterium]|nr:FKBP-type peptidyl-prolyl cis-trans isomerase [Candidatus Saccharimonadales bacterium]